MKEVLNSADTLATEHRKLSALFTRNWRGLWREVIPCSEGHWNERNIIFSATEGHPEGKLIADAWSMQENTVVVTTFRMEESKAIFRRFDTERKSAALRRKNVTAKLFDRRSRKSFIEQPIQESSSRVPSATGKKGVTGFTKVSVAYSSITKRCSGRDGTIDIWILQAATHDMSLKPLEVWEKWTPDVEASPNKLTVDVEASNQ